MKGIMLLELKLIEHDIEFKYQIMLVTHQIWYYKLKILIK